MRTHTRTHARTHTRTHAHTHTRTHARTHAYTHTHTHTRVHELTHTWTHVHTLNRVPYTELPSLPIYWEISRKYSKISPISRSPGFDLQSPAKRIVLSFFYAYFPIFFGRRTVLLAVSHLRYTESAESSRAKTIEVYPTAGSVTCWPSRSMQAAAATV